MLIHFVFPCSVGQYSEHFHSAFMYGTHSGTFHQRLKVISFCFVVVCVKLFHFSSVNLIFKGVNLDSKLTNCSMPLQFKVLNRPNISLKKVKSYSKQYSLFSLVFSVLFAVAYLSFISICEINYFGLYLIHYIIAMEL